MAELGRLCRAALLWLPLAAMPPADGRAQAAEPAVGVGLCPPAAGRLDTYQQALCDGEAALRNGDLDGATDRFRTAAALPRVDASNELAWAGLALARCRALDFEAGGQWALRFTQARRLWLGELDCSAAGDDPRARLGPFVRSRMCTEPLAADYRLLHSLPQSPQAVDLQRRLARIEQAIASACTAPEASPASQPAAAAKPGAKAGKPKASKKRRNPSKTPAKGG
jgi:hypothetical protein